MEVASTVSTLSIWPTTLKSKISSMSTIEEIQLHPLESSI